MKPIYNFLKAGLSLVIMVSVSSNIQVSAQNTFTDHEGNEYKTTTIGDQVWMAENYRAYTFVNGDSITWVSDGTTWDSLGNIDNAPAMSVIFDNMDYLETFGPVYNHYTLTDERGFAPEGWRVPDEADWQALEIYLGIAEADLTRDGWAGADTNAAGRLQVDSTGVYWDSNVSYEKSNSTGFSWIGGGARYNGGGFPGSALAFSSIWSLGDNEADTTQAWRRLTRYDRTDIRRSPVGKASGDYVRLVRDASATSVEPKMNLPENFKLNQNYPNPFNPTTILGYSVPQSSLVKLTVYDMIGRQVSVLVNEVKSAGSHQVRFDASDLPSGIYIYRLQAGNISMTKKMTLMK